MANPLEADILAHTDADNPSADIEKEILRHEDIIKSSLLTTFSTSDDDNDRHNPANAGVPTYQKSEYSSPEHILTYMKQNKDKFTVMSLNLTLPAPTVLANLCAPGGGRSAPPYDLSPWYA